MIILGPVAMAENRVIGKGNDLPWHLPEDLKHFKELTMGKPVLMGRKTFESIMKRLGKPLPGRKSIVITHQKDYQVPAGVKVFYDIQSAIGSSAEDIYVIGGAEIFKQALPFCDLAYVTLVKGQYDGDAYFPEVDWSRWQKLAEEPHEKFSFINYKRLSK